MKRNSLGLCCIKVPLHISEGDKNPGSVLLTNVKLQGQTLKGSVQKTSLS